MRPYEVAPIADEPDIDKTLFLCDECAAGLDARKIKNPDRWRCLTQAMWSEVAAAQVVAVRMLRRMSSDEVRWASEALEDLYLDPEVEAWIDS